MKADSFDARSLGQFTGVRHAIFGRLQGTPSLGSIHYL